MKIIRNMEEEKKYFSVFNDGTNDLYVKDAEALNAQYASIHYALKTELSYPLEASIGGVITDITDIL